MPDKPRVRFEGGEGDDDEVQSIWGGSSRDVEASILRSTERNLQIIGWRIISVEDVVGDLGTGMMQKISFQMKSGESTKTMTITGIGLEVMFE